MDLPIKEHSADSSKMLVKVVIVMLIILQLMGGFIVKSFYDRFVALEEANDKNDRAIEELKAQIKVIEIHATDMFLLQNKGAK